MHNSSPSPHIFRPHKLLIYFLEKSFVCTSYPETLSVIRMGDSSVSFGQNCFDWQGQNSPSTSHHPQTDRQTEIVNKWLEGYLRNYVSAQQQAWIKWIHLEDYCYNTTYHMSIRMAPFKALYGYEPLSFIDTMLGESLTKGKGLSSGGTGHPIIPKGKPTTGTESRKDVRRQTPN